MPVMDEFKKEREAIRQKSLKEKLAYFFYYYKWHTLIAVILLIGAFHLISQMVNRKDCALYVCLMNTMPSDKTEDYVQSFEKYAGIDRSKSEVLFDTSMAIEIGGRDQLTATSFQKLAVYTAAGDLDLIITKPDLIYYYVDQQIYRDLRQLLTPEQYALYEPYFFYVDQAIVDILTDAQDKGETYEAVFSDPRQPETMENPVPVGIFLDECSKLKESVQFGNEENVLAVISTSSHVETGLKFIDFIMQEP